MKIAFSTLPASGHLNPMTTLGRRFQSHGHDVVFIALPDAIAPIQAAGLEYISYCENEFPSGWFKSSFRELSQLDGEDAVQYSFNVLGDLLNNSLKQLPETIAKAGIDALVLDATQYYLGLLPMHLSLPFIHVSPGLPLDLSGATPPRFFGWPFATTPTALERNRDGVARVRQLMKPCTDVARAYSKQVGLEVDWNEPDPTISKLAWIAQMPREFDFPSEHWPSQFHYTGPFHDDAGRTATPFPWERITGEPLIYASMGTLQNGQKDIFQIIVDAAEKLSGFQLVLSIGNNLHIDQINYSLPKTIVVNQAPQLQLLKRAALCVTHAGMNTTLEALTQGVPMIALPVTNDQPAVAARIVYHHVGETLPLSDLTPSVLHATMSRVVGEPSYQSQAQLFQESIAKCDGLEIAVEIVERSFGIRRRARSLSIER